MVKKSTLSALFAFSLLLCAGYAVGTAHAATLTPEEQEQYQTFVAEGLALLREGGHENLTRSIGRFKAALRLRPESAEAYYWTAVAFSDLKSYRAAADNAKEATIYDDKLADAWLLWGQALLYQREWKDARDKLEQASRLDPENPLVLYNQGRVYYHGFKDHDSALPKFRAVWQKSQALRRQNPDFASLVVNARLYMGFCEFDRKRWDNAINAFREVLTEQPYNFEAALRMALAYRRSNRAAECERILWNMLRALPPDNPVNRQMLAEINLQLADLYIKDPVLKQRMLALTHLQEFVNIVISDNLSHPAFDAAREYLAMRNPQNDTEYQ